MRSACLLQGHGEVSSRDLGGSEAGPAWDSPDEFADPQEAKPTLLNRLGFRRSARPATPPEGLPPGRQQCSEGLQTGTAAVIIQSGSVNLAATTQDRLDCPHTSSCRCAGS